MQTGTSLMGGKVRQRRKKFGESVVTVCDHFFYGSTPALLVLHLNLQMTLQRLRSLGHHNLQVALQQVPFRQDRTRLLHGFYNFL